MVFLGQVATGRDNNLNLIRMIAAFAVLVSHAWPIALGPDAVQPFKILTGQTLGTLAVWVFFAISGYLISLSFVRTADTSQFVMARVRRLMPGLIISVLFVAFVLGPIVTTLPFVAYVTDTATSTFILRNITMVAPQYTLPGVFDAQPYTAVVGSIWTLFYEVLCYAGVFIVGILSLFKNPRMMGLVLGLYAALWLSLSAFAVELHPKLSALHQLSLPFAIGMALYLWRNYVPLHGSFVIAGAVFVSLLSGTWLYTPAFVTVLSYATFWCAYVPGGLIRAYNKVGDYSYGLYIYAFPLQGLAVWLVPDQGPWMNVAIATPLTLICAIASWHLVEQPFLRRPATVSRSPNASQPQRD